MAVITISNQFGAGGPELGRELASRLGYDYLDKEIIHKVALEVNVPDAEVAEFEEIHHNKLRSFFSTIFDLDALKKKAQVEEAEKAAEAKFDDRDSIPFQYHVDGWIDSEIYKGMITKVISALGQKGNVVIAGRGGQHILQDCEGTLHIRLVGNLEDRVARIAKHKGLSSTDAKKFVTTLDSRSRDYLKFYFDCDPDQPSVYDLVLNTSRLDIDKCADVVEGLIK